MNQKLYELYGSETYGSETYGSETMNSMDKKQYESETEWIRNTMSGMDQTMYG